MSLAHVNECHVPTLKRVDIVVVMDNLPVHKMAGVKKAIEAAGSDSSLRQARRRRQTLAARPCHESDRFPMAVRCVADRTLGQRIGLATALSR
jgi:hypothetical protein